MIKILSFTLFVALFELSSCDPLIRLPIKSVPRQKSSNLRSTINDTLINYGYNAPLFVGNPPQEMPVFFDTGSYHVVFSMNENKNPHFYCNQSTTCIQGPDTSDIPWGHNGTWVYDDICLDHGRTVCSTNTTFGVLYANSTSVLYDPPIWGSALGGIRRNQSIEPLSKIFQNTSACPEPVFAIFAKNLVNSNGAPKCGEEFVGELQICGIDPAINKNDIHWMPADPENYNATWNIPVYAIYYGDTLIYGNLSYSMVDTGDNYLMLPPEAYDKMMQLIGGKDGQYECDTATSLLPIKVTLDGKNYTIEAESYVDPCSIDGPECLLHIDRGEDMHSGLHSPFLRSRYTIFDAYNARIGVYDFGK